MDRKIVYPGAIPQDGDILNIQRYVLEALGLFMRGVLTDGTWIRGLGVIDAGGSRVTVQPGEIYVVGQVDATNFGSLGTIDRTIIKQGLLKYATTFDTPAPGTAGHSINYLVQARYLEVDGDATVLPYYNAGNPAVPYNGPNNTGAAQNISRRTTCDVQVVAGASAPTGTQATPPVSMGYIGLALVTVDYGGAPSLVLAHPMATSASIAKALVTQILTADGIGSGLDADKFQGLAPSAFRKKFRGALVYGHAATKDTPIVFTGESYDTDAIYTANGVNTDMVVPAGVSKVKLSAHVEFDNTPAQIYEAAIVGGGALLPSIRVQSSETELTNGKYNLESAVISVNPGDTFYLINFWSTLVANKSWFAMEIVE